METKDNGWEWFAAQVVGAQPRHRGATPDHDETQKAFVRCFSTDDGQRVLRHLRRMTLDRALGPSASDALLRHLEGQRQIIIYILGLSRQGADEERETSAGLNSSIDTTEIDV